MKSERTLTFPFETSALMVGVSRSSSPKNATEEIHHAPEMNSAPRCLSGIDDDDEPTRTPRDVRKREDRMVAL